MFVKRAGSFPVSETEAILERITTQHGDECEDDESNNQENLSKGEPEFGFSVPLYCEEVDDTKNVSHTRF